MTYGRSELYDLSKDIGQRDNIAAKQTQKVNDLKQVFGNWLHRVNANLPAVNNGYTPE